MTDEMKEKYSVPDHRESLVEMWRTHAEELAKDRDRERDLRLMAETALSSALKDRDRMREALDKIR